MKLKKVLPLCIFLAISPLFAKTNSVKAFENYAPKIHLTTCEKSTLLKLNALNKKNKNTVLAMLNSLYDKELEKKIILKKQENLED